MQTLDTSKQSSQRTKCGVCKGTIKVSPSAKECALCGVKVCKLLGWFYVFTGFCRCILLVAMFHHKQVLKPRRKFKKKVLGYAASNMLPNSKNNLEI